MLTFVNEAITTVVIIFIMDYFLMWGMLVFCLTQYLRENRVTLILLLFYFTVKSLRKNCANLHENL